jgi:hypothetical protein
MKFARSLAVRLAVEASGEREQVPAPFDSAQRASCGLRLITLAPRLFFAVDARKVV